MKYPKDRGRKRRERGEKDGQAGGERHGFRCPKKMAISGNHQTFLNHGLARVKNRDIHRGHGLVNFGGLHADLN